MENRATGWFLRKRLAGGERKNQPIRGNYRCGSLHLLRTPLLRQNGLTALHFKLETDDRITRGGVDPAAAAFVFPTGERALVIVRGYRFRAEHRGVMVGS